MVNLCMSELYGGASISEMKVSTIQSVVFNQDIMNTISSLARILLS